MLRISASPLTRSKDRDYLSEGTPAHRTSAHRTLVYNLMMDLKMDLMMDFLMMDLMKDLTMDLSLTASGVAWEEQEPCACT